MHTLPSLGAASRLLAGAGSTRGRGDAPAPLDRLFAVVYDDLHRRAHRQRAGWAGALTLNTTALVHEAYEKLAGAEEAGTFENRAHFLAVASHAMRQVLLDYAKKQRALKRGGDAAHVTLGDQAALGEAPSFDQILTLDDALRRLRDFNPEGAEIVTCRFYGGLSVEETAAALGISEPTVKRRWRSARAWLYREVGADGGPHEVGIDRKPAQRSAPRRRVHA